MNLTQFQTTGRNLSVNGLTTSSTGNLSIRLKDDLLITRHGSILGRLEESDLVKTGIFKDDNSTPLASSELAVHRAIYRSTLAQAIVHAHPPCAVSLSLDDEITIPDSPESFGTSKMVPVLGRGMDIKPGALGDIIAEALTNRKIVMVYSHGSFAVGQTLDEACKYTINFEEYCRVMFLLRISKCGDILQ
jgi:L-fuculose-phosphate aldolase